MRKKDCFLANVITARILLNETTFVFLRIYVGTRP